MQQRFAGNWTAGTWEQTGEADSVGNDSAADSVAVAAAAAEAQGRSTAAILMCKYIYITMKPLQSFPGYISVSFIYKDDCRF